MINQLKNKLSRYTWQVAYGKFTEDILKHGINFNNLNYVNNPYKSDKWFADPFILAEYDDKIEFLVEEYDRHINKGRIANIVVDKKTNIIVDFTIILELPTHLSFPAIYRYNNSIYVHPENSASGKSILYKYDVHNKRLVEAAILSDEPLIDPIILENQGIYELYATKHPQSCGPQLAVYTSDNLLGPYVFSKYIDFNTKTARMAGKIIKSNGKKVWPCQDCRNDYGEAVMFYNLDISIFLLSEIRPATIKYSGVHTFNVLGDTFVIDLKCYDYPITHKIMKVIKNFVKH